MNCSDIDCKKNDNGQCIVDVCILNEEFCEWEELEYKLFRTGCRMGAIVPDQISFDSYKYCHYCGKPIKIKE